MNEDKSKDQDMQAKEEDGVSPVSLNALERVAGGKPERNGPTYSPYENVVRKWRWRCGDCNAFYITTIETHGPCVRCGSQNVNPEQN